MANKIQIRRDTAANWTSTNPTLSQGEQGYEIDTSKFKIGDGTTAWTSLSYFSGYTDADVDTHLNTSTATSGEVLSWTGTDYDWITAGGGGGSPDLFAENYDGTSTLPSATGTNAIAIGTNAVATNTYSFAGPMSRTTGGGSFSCNINSTSSSYGAQGVSSVAIGPSAKTTTNWSYALGRNAASTAQYAVILGGYACEASANYGYAFGHRGKAEFIGKYAFGVYTSNTVGGSQGGYMVLARNTTDATAGPLCSTGGTGTGSTDNQVILPNNSAYTFSGTIVARQQAATGTDVGAWEVKGIIRREANAGTTVLVNSVLNEINAPTGWAVALTADTTNGGLKIEVTGVASTNIRWVANIQTAEVTYA